VLAYLGRYTHRIALSHERILSLHDGIVHFRWRDYADGNRSKLMALLAEEFLRRLTGIDLARCPLCQGGTLRVVARLARGATPPETRDTS